MASYFTSNTLIEDVKRRGMLPENESTFSKQDYLALANEEMLIGIIPTIISLHEEYYVYNEQIALVANQSEYQIPSRAMGSKLRDLSFEDTNGTVYEMTRISPDDLSYFQSSNFQNNLSCYYIKGDTIVLIPEVGSGVSGYLNFTYFIRPNELVLEERIATITGITVGANTTSYTCTVPSTISTAFNADAGTLFDILQKKAGHRIKVFDIIANSMSGTTIVFSNTNLPSGASTIEIGDYIALAGECIIPQLPDELHSVLSQRVVTRCMEAMGDQASLQSANAKLAEMEQKTSILIDNRVEGAPQKIRSRAGLLH